MTNVNDFKGLTDSDVLDNAMANIGNDRIVVIPPRISDIEPERTWWLIDGVIDTSTEKYSDYGAVILLGNDWPAWGLSHGKCMRNLSISNIISNSYTTFAFRANVYDSVISNVVCYNGERPLAYFGKDIELVNVKVSGFTGNSIK